MDTFEEATGAERQTTVVTTTCWECGEERPCHEYVVCCTGTLFHLCPECEAKLDDEDRDG